MAEFELGSISTNKRDEVSFPQQGIVRNVRREWALHEDQALAYRLQNEEYTNHLGHNKSRNALLRHDTPHARQEQVKVDEEAARLQQQILQEMDRQEAHDAAVAAEIAAKLEEDERQEKLNREKADREYARKLAAAEKARVREKKELKQVEREAAYLGINSTKDEAAPTLLSPAVHSQPSTSSAAAPSSNGRQPTENGTNITASANRRRRPLPLGAGASDIYDLSDFCVKPSEDMDEDEARALQEEQDAEVARLLGSQEHMRRGDRLHHDQLMAIQAQDQELAKVLQEQERAKAKKAREKARQKAMLKKQLKRQQAEERRRQAAMEEMREVSATSPSIAEDEVIGAMALSRNGIICSDHTLPAHKPLPHSLRRVDSEHFYDTPEDLSTSSYIGSNNPSPLNIINSASNPHSNNYRIQRYTDYSSDPDSNYAMPSLSDNRPSPNPRSNDSHNQQREQSSTPSTLANNTVKSPAIQPAMPTALRPTVPLIKAVDTIDSDASDNDEEDEDIEPYASSRFPPDRPTFSYMQSSHNTTQDSSFDELGHHYDTPSLLLARNNDNINNSHDTSSSSPVPPAYSPPLPEHNVIRTANPPPPPPALGRPVIQLTQADVSRSPEAKAAQQQQQQQQQHQQIGVQEHSISNSISDALEEQFERLECMDEDSRNANLTTGDELPSYTARGRATPELMNSAATPTLPSPRSPPQSPFGSIHCQSPSFHHQTQPYHSGPSPVNNNNTRPSSTNSYNGSPCIAPTQSPAPSVSARSPVPQQQQRSSSVNSVHPSGGVPETQSPVPSETHSIHSSPPQHGLSFAVHPNPSRLHDAMLAKNLPQSPQQQQHAVLVGHQHSPTHVQTVSHPLQQQLMHVPHHHQLAHNIPYHLQHHPHHQVPHHHHHRFSHPSTLPHHLEAQHHHLEAQHHHLPQHMPPSHRHHHHHHHIPQQYCLQEQQEQQQQHFALLQQRSLQHSQQQQLHQQQVQSEQLHQQQAQSEQFNQTLLAAKQHHHERMMLAIQQPMQAQFIPRSEDYPAPPYMPIQGQRRTSSLEKAARIAESGILEEDEDDVLRHSSPASRGKNKRQQGGASGGCKQQ